MKKNILICLILIMLLPMHVYALSGNIILNCPTSGYNPGNDVECSININVDSDISGVSFSVSPGNGVTAVDFIPESGWDGAGISGETVRSEHDGAISGLVTLGTLKFNISETAESGNVNVSLTNVKYYAGSDDTEGTSIDDASDTIEVVVQEQEVGLQSLYGLSGGVLSPSFSEDNDAYTFILDSYDTTTFSIYAEAKNSDETVSAMNEDTEETIDLSNITFKTSSGKTAMMIIITVGSRSYYVTVIRPNPPDVDTPHLTSLKVAGKVIALVDGKYNYEIALSDLNNYTIEAIINDTEHFKFSDSTIVNLSPYTLSGTKDIEIRIVPSDDSTNYGEQVYLLKIVSDSASSSSSSLIKPSTTSNGGKTPGNPGTGGMSTSIVFFVLVMSFAASIYIYKKNLNDFN